MQDSRPPIADQAMPPVPKSVSEKFAMPPLPRSLQEQAVDAIFSIETDNQFEVTTK